MEEVTQIREKALVALNAGVDKQQVAMAVGHHHDVRDEILAWEAPAVPTYNEHVPVGGEFGEDVEATIPQEREKLDIEAEAINEPYAKSVESTRVMKVRDGDTLDKASGGGGVRLGFGNTEESVHEDSSRNTDAGEAAAKFQKTMLQQGDDIEVKKYATDVFDRDVAQVDRMINGVPIDMMLVSMDQGFAQFYDKYGVHPDPRKHNQYKEYYSIHAPYQYGLSEERLTKEEFAYVTAKQKEFTAAYSAYVGSGKADRRELDAATVALYKDPDLIARYRHQAMNWDRKEEVQGTLRESMVRSIKNNPRQREAYNLANRDGENKMDALLPKDVGWFTKAKAMFSSQNSIAQLIDYDELWEGREHKSDLNLPTEDLLRNVPFEYHGKLLEETDQYGQLAAFNMKEQLLDDLANKKVLDNMSLGESLGYGVAAAVVDPLTWIAGAPIAKAGMMTHAAVKSWQLTAGADAIAGLSTWAAMGAAEGMVVNAPKLGGDHTYTPRDYTLDVVMDTSFGTGLGVLGRGYGVLKEMKVSRELEADHIRTLQETGSPVVANNTPEFRDGIVQEDAHVQAYILAQRQTPLNEQPVVDGRVEPELPKTPEQLQAEADALRAIPLNKRIAFTPLDPEKARASAEKPPISEAGFATAAKHLRKVFKDTPKSGVTGEGVYKRVPMKKALVKGGEVVKDKHGRTVWVDDLDANGQKKYKLKQEVEQNYGRHLINQIAKMNETAVKTPEMVEALVEVNRQVVEIASLYPDGRIPKEVNDALEKLIYGERNYTRINAVEQITRGIASIDTLRDYTAQLQRQLDFKGRPMDNDTFIRRMEKSLGIKEQLGDELTLWRDLVEAAKSSKGESKQYQMEQAKLNGILWKRYNDFLDNRDLATPTVKPNPEAVQLTPVEIQKQLAKEFPEDKVAKKKLFDDAYENAKTAILKKSGRQTMTKAEKARARSTASAAAQEGMPRSPEYKARLEELQYKGQEVSPDVQEIGEVVEFKREKELFSDERGLTEQSAENQTNERSTDTQYDIERRELGSKSLNTRQIIANLKAEKADGLLDTNGKFDQDLWDARYAELERHGIDAEVDTKTPVEYVEDYVAGDIYNPDSKLNLQDGSNYGDLLHGDALPRSTSKTPTKQIIDKPTPPRVKELKDRLKPFLKGLEQAKADIFREELAQRLRAPKVEKLVNVNSGVLRGMLEPSRTNEIGEILARSAEVAKQKKLEIDNKPKVEGAETEVPMTPFTEEELEVLVDQNQGVLANKVSDEEYKLLEEKMNTTSDELAKISSNKIAGGLNEFVASGEKAGVELRNKGQGALDYLGKFANLLTKGLADKFLEGKLTSMQYIGAKITESGLGFKGTQRRKVTAAIARDATYKESMMKLAPQYINRMRQYVASKGGGAYKTVLAQQQAGVDNAIVKQFNRDVFKIQELRRQGKKLPETLDQSVIKFVDEWDEYMDFNHNKLVEQNISGFTKDRKVKHYIPHIWKKGNLEGAIKKYGEPHVLELFTRAYQSSSRNGINPVDVTQARKLAQRQVEWIKTQGNDSVDQILPMTDSRAKQRLDLDTTMEYEGVSIMDLLDDDVISLGTKYSNKVAGWSGLSEATNGVITSQRDIDTLRASMVQEGLDKNVSTKKHEIMFDDLMDMMFARPMKRTVNGEKRGLPEEVRQIKDFTAMSLIRGSLGSSQLIETGQVMTRSVLNLFSSEKVAKKVLSAGAAGDSESRLIRELQELSNLTDDLEWLDRQSVHLDQAQLGEIGKTRELSLWLADKATGGSLKAPADRILGKVSAYNAIRRFQSRASQMSFALDVSKHFKDGTGKMGNARMADIGLTDVNGRDAGLENVFKNIVEYDADGALKSLHIEKWPEQARKNFQYALIRDEAQQVQRTHIGELPPWMNRPLMGLIFQFREMPIVAMQKQLGRSMAFADKEAVVSVMLNAAVAGVVRYGKFAALGTAAHALTGSEGDTPDPTGEQMQVHKYIAQAGMFPDVTDLVLDSYHAGQSGETNDWLRVLGQVPMFSMGNSVYDLAAGNKNEKIAATQNVVLGANTALGDILHTMIQQKYGD